MKKIRLPLFIFLGLLIALFIVGSFLDLQINEALFSKNNPVGVFASAVGTLPGYGLLAFLGGVFFWCGFHGHSFNIPARVIFYVIAIAAFVCGVFFSGREFFSQNGYYELNSIFAVGFIIALPFMSFFGFAGYYMSNKLDNDNIWLFAAVIAVAVFMSLVPGVTLLKSIFHRPRYRLICEYEQIGYYNWWERCSSYKDWIKIGEQTGNLDLSKENFKSFPSGHAGATMVFVFFAAFIPAFGKKYDKWQLPLMIIGFAYCLLICFTRMLVGAHYLSDVSMGAILTCFFIIIANEVFIRNKRLSALMNHEEERIEEAE